MPARVAKRAIRLRAWSRLEKSGEARFPYPPHGRIPNFAGAREAAERLFELPVLTGARCIKVNPDAPQRPVREGALRRGLRVLVPTPRLRAGFLCLDPARIPASRLAEAAGLSKLRRFAREVPLDRLPTPDVLVVGSVAVGARGGRCGKGEGYADLEYGILRELGHPAMPVVTTVHDLQLVPEVPREPTDLPVHWIATPTRTLRVARPGRAPRGIAWSRLADADLAAMPPLAELASRRRGRSGRGRSRPR